jgi:hypothetical protein
MDLDLYCAGRVYADTKLAQARVRGAARRGAGRVGGFCRSATFRFFSRTR